MLVGLIPWLWSRETAYSSAYIRNHCQCKSFQWASLVLQGEKGGNDQQDTHTRISVIENQSELIRQQSERNGRLTGCQSLFICLQRFPKASLVDRLPLCEHAAQERERDCASVLHICGCCIMARLHSQHKIKCEANSAMLGVSLWQGWKLEEPPARTGLDGNCITGVASIVDQTARTPDLALDPDHFGFIPNMACEQSQANRACVGTSLTNKGKLCPMQRLRIFRGIVSPRPFYLDKPGLPSQSEKAWRSC